MSLPCCLLDTLLFLRVPCRLLFRLLGLLLLPLLFVLGGLLSLLLLFVLGGLLGLLWLSLFTLAWLLCLLRLRLFALGWLFGLRRFVLILWLGVLLGFRLSMLLRRLRMFLLLLLFGLGVLVFLLCEGRSNCSESQKQYCCSESRKCFHWYFLDSSVSVGAAISCTLLTAGRFTD